MIQDIDPRTFNNQYHARAPQPADLFLAYQGDSVLVREDKDKLWYPAFSDFAATHPELMAGATYLFSIDDINYFLASGTDLDTVPGWSYASTARFRTEPKYWRSFAGAVGWQLNRWYQNHQFCSRCGKPVIHSDAERMLSCPACGFQTYPTLSPVVIVGVYSGNRLLLTKYAKRPQVNFALVAGFAEIGESLETTVRREVLEEVGLKVKNLRFYKTQPWPFTDTLLTGFFAELDGDDTITLQEDELALGVWMEREDIPPAEYHISLTSEMMEAFRTGAIDLS